MRDLKYWKAISIAMLMFLAISDLAFAQPFRWERHQIDPTQILTIRIYFHPDLTPHHPVMDIHLKDPNQPVFRLNGDDGNIVEQFRHMQELAMLFKKQRVTLIYDSSGYRTMDIHPFARHMKYSRKMYNIIGFYGIGFPAGGPVPSAGQSGSPKMMPAQSIPRPASPPPAEPERERMMHEPPPQEQIGFCCLHGNVVEAPVHACDMEGGEFFPEFELAHQRCRRDGMR